jgi:anti-sigma factor RsiW
MKEEKTCVSSMMSSLINDYVEGRLTSTQSSLFADYLDSDEELKTFVQKSKKGKRALSRANRMIAAPNFWEKLLQEIAHEEVQQV